MAWEQWSELVDRGVFDEDTALYLFEQGIDDPTTIANVTADFHDDGWTIEVDHDDDETLVFEMGPELDEWWWDEMYYYLEELGEPFDLDAFYE